MFVMWQMPTNNDHGTYPPIIVRVLLEFDVDLLTFSFQVFIYLHVTLVTLSGCSLHPLSLYVVFWFLPFYIYTYWYLDVLFH